MRQQPATATIEVRVESEDQLVVVEPCESYEEAFPTDWVITRQGGQT